MDIGKVDLGVGNVIIVFKNGKPDEALTKQGNDEMNGQYWQSLGANAGKVLLGLVQMVAGYASAFISLTAGTGGNLVLSLSSGGTLTIPITLVAATGTSVSLAYAAQGSATLIDGLTQIALANQGLQLSFAQGPTSQRFGKNVSTRYGSDTIDDIRVDAEIDSGKIQIQSGSGKKGYKINSDIPVEQITDENSVKKWIKTIPQLKNITDFEQNKLIRYVLQASRYLKAMRR